MLTTACFSLGVGCCGGSDDEVPANGVAKVGDTVITKAAFEGRLDATLASQAGTDGKPIKLEPPDFAACLASKKKAAVVPEGEKEANPADLKKACEREYEQARISVVEYLVQNEWIQKEARRRNLEVTDAQATKIFERLKKEQFKTEAAYQKFLKAQGRTNADLFENVRIQLLQKSLNAQILKGKAKASDAEVRRHYEKNKKQFGQPERRSMRIVLAKTEAEAEKAKQALDSGEAWSSVAKRYSRDKGTAERGGLLPEVTQTGDKKLDEAVKQTPTDTVSGPVKSQFGWVVFEVEKVLPATVPPLSDVRKQVVDAVKTEKRQRVLDTFARNFRERYRGETFCATDYKVASCENGPEQNPTASTPSMQPEAAPEQDN